MSASDCDHIFVTTISAEKFDAVVARSCRAPVVVELQGADPTTIPQTRLFGVSFTTVEDRDRLRIAMRFVDKEQATKPRVPAPAVGAHATVGA